MERKKAGFFVVVHCDLPHGVYDENLTKQQWQ